MSVDCWSRHVSLQIPRIISCGSSFIAIVARRKRILITWLKLNFLWINKFGIQCRRAWFSMLTCLVLAWTGIHLHVCVMFIFLSMLSTTTYFQLILFWINFETIILWTQMHWLIILFFWEGKQLYYPTKLTLNQFHANKGQKAQDNKAEGEGKMTEAEGATTNILIHEWVVSLTGL